jgi:hypothetical protein
MITQRIDDLTYADIERLVEQKVPESRVLDYKRDLPGGSSDDVKELLADVTSFANASGGHLVFGVTTAKVNGKNTAVPESIVGVGDINSEEVENRLNAQLSSLIQPRIVGLRVKAITETGKPTVVVIHIPRSWNAPHMIGKGSAKFYSRSSAGKQPLDVTEIRHAFAMSESVGERIKAFRDERIGRILSGDSSVPISNGAAVVLHMIPVRAFAEHTALGISAIREATRNIKPIYSGSGWGHRNTFDGVCTSTKEGEHTVGYVLCFRNGAIEAVDTYMLRENPKNGRGNLIPSQALEKKLIYSGNEYYDVLKCLEVAPPFVCFLSLLNVRGHICHSGLFFESVTHAIDRDHLLMPDVLVEDAEVAADEFLRPALDTLWQSCGGDGSPFYRDDGKWKLQP